MVLFQDKILNIEKERKGTMWFFLLFFFLLRSLKIRSGILKFPMCKNPGRMFFAQGQQDPQQEASGETWEWREAAWLFWEKPLFLILAAADCGFFSHRCRGHRVGLGHAHSHSLRVFLLQKSWPLISREFSSGSGDYRWLSPTMQFIPPLFCLCFLLPSSSLLFLHSIYSSFLWLFTSLWTSS